MRVLVAAPDLLMTRTGGLRTQVIRTTDELKNMGCRVDFFDSSQSYRRDQYDVAHVFSMNLPTFYKAQALRSIGLPLVFSSVMWRGGRYKAIRATVELLRRSPKLLLNDVVACRLLSEQASRILPNTFQEQLWLERAIGVDGSKCAVVPNGVDDRFHMNIDRKSDRTVFPWGDDEFVLCVAALITRKNLDILADACNRLDLSLALVGPAADPAVVAKLQRHAAKSGRIHLLGQLDGDDPRLGELYRRCRVFCLPSDYETPGIAALEAALTGASIVITEVGGTREYFEDDAYYVKPRHVGDLCNALQKAWNSGRPVDTNSVRQRLLRKFSWRAVARQTFEQYQVAAGQTAIRDAA